ncbi:hypothetical protein M758_UG252800 [Ceratodon purpureus]|nr:hypothetical protein M758_UG252800 [Ceratodon purpureus]
MRERGGSQVRSSSICLALFSWWKQLAVWWELKVKARPTMSSGGAGLINDGEEEWPPAEKDPTLAGCSKGTRLWLLEKIFGGKDQREAYGELQSKGLQ